LLFQIQDDHAHHLAYVEWYDVADQRDQETFMSVVRRSGRYNVVSIHAIVRGVHLMPFFDSRNAAQKALESNKNVYEFEKYVINKYVDRTSWEEIY
jgi:hypothetical protein